MRESFPFVSMMGTVAPYRIYDMMELKVQRSNESVFGAR